MALKIGTQLGSHEITALLGKGGMGEVYRARDTKLKRDVAIKILPEEFSRDADRVSRFQREAEVLASLWMMRYNGNQRIQATREVSVRANRKKFSDVMKKSCGAAAPLSVANSKLGQNPLSCLML